MVVKHTDSITIKPFGRNVHYISMAKTPSFVVHRHASCLLQIGIFAPRTKEQRTLWRHVSGNGSGSSKPRHEKTTFPSTIWRQLIAVFLSIQVQWSGLTLSRNAWPLLWYLCYRWQAFEERHSFVRLAQILCACSGHFVCCCHCGHKGSVVRCFVNIN
jgi:hypothetical protein